MLCEAIKIHNTYNCSEVWEERVEELKLIGKDISFLFDCWSTLQEYGREENVTPDKELELGGKEMEHSLTKGKLPDFMKILKPKCLLRRCWPKLINSKKECIHSIVYKNYNYY